MTDLDIITTTGENGVTVVTIAGPLDHRTAARARDALLGLSTTGRHRIVVDLAHVNDLDAAGLRLLRAARDRAERHGGRLVLAEAPGLVRQILRRLMQDAEPARSLPAFTTVAEAAATMADALAALSTAVVGT